MFHFAREIGGGEIFAIVRTSGCGDQADVAEVQHHGAPPVDIHTELRGYFSFGWSTLQGRRKIASGRFHLFVTPAHVTGGPIELAQAIEDRTLDAVLGIARKDDLFFGIILVGRVEQAKDAGMNQIVEIDVNREIFVNANGDGFYQRKMFQYHAVAPGQTGILRRTVRLQVDRRVGGIVHL